YGYVLEDPVNEIDPLGLKCNVCKQKKPKNPDKKKQPVVRMPPIEVTGRTVATTLRVLINQMIVTEEGAGTTLDVGKMTVTTIPDDVTVLPPMVVKIPC